MPITTTAEQQQQQHHHHNSTVGNHMGPMGGGGRAGGSVQYHGKGTTAPSNAMKSGGGNIGHRGVIEDNSLKVNSSSQHSLPMMYNHLDFGEKLRADQTHGGRASIQQQQQQQYMQQQHMHHTNRHVSPVPSPNHQQRSSSSGGVDYTQVSPAKMALRRHLSQEKLSTAPPSAPKTIGDLVNGEIERTLEISHQSIINAAVNMSTNHQPPLEVYNIQRPERVNVRGPEDYSQQLGGAFRGHEMGSRMTGSAHQEQQHSKKNSSSSGGGGGASSGSKNSTNLFMNSYTQNSLNSFRYSGGSNERKDVNMSTAGGLPRAEMKPYLEQYFLDDKFGSGGGGRNRGGGRAREDQDAHRMSGPLEGLAASLQARVRATLNIKEEPDLRGMQGQVPMKVPMHHHLPMIKQEGGLCGEGGGGIQICTNERVLKANDITF